jgi:hypothetical protein
VALVAGSLLACLVVGLFAAKVLSAADARTGPQQARRHRPPNDFDDQPFWD